MKTNAMKFLEELNKQMCQSCGKREATLRRVYYHDVHCEPCVLAYLDGTFEPIVKEII